MKLLSWNNLRIYFINFPPPVEEHEAIPTTVVIEESIIMDKGKVLTIPSPRKRKVTVERKQLVLATPQGSAKKPRKLHYKSPQGNLQKLV